MLHRSREILGVGTAAGRDEIVAAYRRLAMKWHPDRNADPQAKARFQEIQNAYQTLQVRLSPKNTHDLWADMMKTSDKHFSQKLYDEGIVAQIPFMAILFIFAGAAALAVLELPGNIILFSFAVWAANNTYKVGATSRALQVAAAFRLAVRWYFIGLLACGVWALAHRVAEYGGFLR